VSSPANPSGRSEKKGTKPSRALECRPRRMAVGGSSARTLLAVAPAIGWGLRGGEDDQGELASMGSSGARVTW
jgi:hypothetical protein